MAIKNSKKGPSGDAGELVDIDSLILDPRNARIHNDRNLSMITDSLRETGTGRSILIDDEGHVIAGNGTLRAAARAGITKVKVVDTDGNTLIAVRRSGIDAAQRTRMALFDNRTAETAEWDWVVLEELYGEGMLDRMFSDDELPFLQVSDEGDPEPGEGGDEFDDTPDEEQTRVQAGDVWRCGDHLVACGDSTEPALWGQLLGKERASICWTDPPWNVDYGGSAHPSWKKRTIANDNLGKDFVVFATQFAVQIAEWCLPGAPLYMAMSAQEWPVIDKVLRDAGFHWSSTVIWVKDSLVLSRKDYHTQYEPIWYGWKEGAARLVELEDRTQSDTWFIPRPKRSDEHPTMKPIALVERSLRNSSAPGAIVIDPFGGSGTTLIAAERCRRRAVVAELSPAYCDVIVRRWETETKRQAEKLNERPRETQKAEEGKASARKTNKAHS